MFDFTTESVLNDLSRVSAIDDTTKIATPGTVTPTGSTTGGALAAATYYYKVTALTARGETLPSAEASVTTTGTTGSVGLAWVAITGATGYNVYRGTGAGLENVYYSVIANAFTDVGGVAVARVPPSVSTAYVINDSGVPGGDKALFIKRLNKYLASAAGKVYRRLATTAVKEVATIALPSTGNTGGVYRLNLDVTMSGSYPIDYDRWAINKGKPFFVEVLVPTGTYTDAQLVAILAPKFIKGLLKYNGQNITDIVPSAATGSIVVTASNEYQRFKNAIIEIEDALGEVWTTVSTGTVTTHGLEGFGSAWFITKNLRLPTQEATRFYGLDQDERPINGVMYNQYTFQYSAGRNFTGTGAVGSIVTSKTTHVLFVPSTLSATFEGYITTAFGAGSLLDAVTSFPIN
jgi:hypothetical protein